MALKMYRKPSQASPSFTATATSLVEDAKAICDRTRKLLDKIAADVAPETVTFENVILPMAKDENNSNLQTRIIGFYQAVSGDGKLRDASSKAEEIMDEFGIGASMREDIFKLVDAAYKKGDKLDPESQRLLEKARKSYITNGLGIPAGPQSIQIEFQKNLNEENGGIWFTKKELEGVPDDVVQGFEKGTGDNEGKLRFTFKYPDLFPALKFALDSEVRQRIFIENENKYNQNVPLFKEAIILRDEAARLLRYPDHAPFRIEDKMAKTPKTVNDFLDDLRVQFAPGGVKETEYLKEIKKEDLISRGLESTNDGNYYLWDTRFYNRMMVEKEFSIDKQKIAEYFPLQSTIEGMLTIFEELFGFVFLKIDSEERIKLSETGKADDIYWHEDVKILSFWDDEEEGGSFVGYLYLDLHPRLGKYSHAANFSLQPGFLFPNGSRRYPATALVCNFSKPTPTKPSLLKHDEVVTLFHELGHGIHDLAGRTYSCFHGTSVVRDFVEASSQMLEHWCWTPSQLKSLSKHYLTGEPIPDDLIEKQISVKHVNDALFNLRQLHFGIFDMTVHTPKSRPEAESFEYLPLQSTIEGMSAIFEELFGLQQPLDTVSFKSIELIPNGQHKREEEIPIWLDIHKRWQELFGRHLSLQRTEQLSFKSLLALPIWFASPVTAEDHGGGNNDRNDGVKIYGPVLYGIVIIGTACIVRRLAAGEKQPQEASVYYHVLVFASGVVCLQAFTDPNTTLLILVYDMALVFWALSQDRIHKFRLGFRSNERRHLLFELVCAITSAYILTPQSGFNFAQTLLLTTCGTTCLYEWLRRQWLEAVEHPPLIPMHE